MAFAYSSVERDSGAYTPYCSSGEKSGVGWSEFDTRPLGFSSIGNIDDCGSAQLQGHSQKNEDTEVFAQLMLNASIENFDQIAQDLLSRFGSIAAALRFFQSDDAKIDGLDRRAVDLFKSIAKVVSSSLRSEALTQPLLSSSKALHNYLRFTMSGLHRETARVLFLNSENRLLADKTVSAGSVNSVQIYPREIVKEALGHNATALILVHNHPSGSAEPSKSDILVTRRLQRACNVLEMTLHDHLIVSRSGISSLRASGLFR